MNFRGFRPTAEGRHTGLEQLKLVIFHLIPFLTAVLSTGTSRVLSEWRYTSCCVDFIFLGGNLRTTRAVCRLHAALAHCPITMPSSGN